MSSTIFTSGSYRYYFFSREEERPHVHVTSPDGEAKFWLEPIIALATSAGLSKRQLAKIQMTIVERYNEIRSAWKKHFGR